MNRLLRYDLFIKKMMEINYNIFLVKTFFSVSVVLCISCNTTVKSNMGEKHQWQVNRQGIGMLYADKIPCKAVMQNSNSDGDFHFQCYLVGFTDSIPAAKEMDKKELDLSKYFEYDMQNDWKALIQGDSVAVTFFQPKQKREKNRFEGILVFETASSETPDTLVYTDSNGSWGTQQLVLNGNQQ